MPRDDSHRDEPLRRGAASAPGTPARYADPQTWGQPRDVANPICFLASDLAAYITGTMVDVSGGKLATQIPRLAWEGAAASGEVTLGRGGGDPSAVPVHGRSTRGLRSR